MRQHVTSSVAKHVPCFKDCQFVEVLERIEKQRSETCRLGGYISPTRASTFTHTGSWTSQRELINYILIRNIKNFTMKTLLIACLVAFVASATAQSFFEEEITAWHFHTYFFEVNPSKSAEAIAFRKATRTMINEGNLPDCSLNQIYIGWDGPHPVSQWELCCNKTGYAAAHSWHTQNHGNLSVLVHPLTVLDQEDHMSRASWLGKEVVIDAECPCLYPELPQPRPCPVYPEYSDELPENLDDPQYEIPLPGTEDYLGLRKRHGLSEF